MHVAVAPLPHSYAVMTCTGTTEHSLIEFVRCSEKEFR